MSLIDPQIPKEYQNGRVLFEQNLDAWRESVEDYFATINLNLTQLRKDAFLANYDFDNDGNANLPKNLQQQINDLTSGATPIGGTTSDTWTINSDGNSSILSTAGLTAVRTYTFPDASGVLVVATATQTLSNKTFSDNIVWSSGVAFTGTLDHANTANRTYTFPDFSGTVVLNGSGGSVPFLGNVDVYSGFDFRAYSDAGVTQTAGIDGATGAARFSGNVDAWSGSDFRSYSDAGATQTVGIDGATGNARFSGNVDAWSGSDLRVYSDAGVTQTAGIDGATGNAFFNGNVLVSSPNIGGNRTIAVVNGDNTNASSNALLNITTGGASGGDPVLLFEVSGATAFTQGIANTDNDKYKICADGALNTDVRVEIHPTLVTVGITPAATSTIPSLWISTLDYGFSVNGNDLRFYSVDDFFFLSNGTQVGSLTDAGRLDVTGDITTNGGSSSQISGTRAQLSIYNALTAMAHVTVVNDADNGTIQQQFNVASSTRDLAAPKNYQLTFTTALNNNDAAVLVTAQSGTNNRMFANYYAVGSTDIRVRVKEESGATEYGDFAAIVVGGLV